MTPPPEAPTPLSKKIHRALAVFNLGVTLYFCYQACTSEDFDWGFWGAAIEQLFSANIHYHISGYKIKNETIEWCSGLNSVLGWGAAFGLFTPKIPALWALPTLFNMQNCVLWGTETRSPATAAAAMAP
jgi:hypothetical protein